MPILKNARHEVFAQNLASGMSYVAACEASDVPIRLYEKPAGFYVYLLADPKTDAPFYVGKGKGARARQHEKALRTGGTNPRKLEKIAAIIQGGVSPLIYILEDDMSEPDALRLERKVIHRAKNVLTNASFGQLTNAERFVAESRVGRSKIIPLCRLIKQGADSDRLKMWAWVIDGLAPFCNLAEMKKRFGEA